MFKKVVTKISWYFYTNVNWKLYFSICAVINLVLKSCSRRKAASNYSFPNGGNKCLTFWHFFSNVFVMLFSKQLSSILRAHLPFFTLIHFLSRSFYLPFSFFFSSSLCNLTFLFSILVWLSVSSYRKWTSTDPTAGFSNTSYDDHSDLWSRL